MYRAVIALCFQSILLFAEPRIRGKHIGLNMFIRAVPHKCNKVHYSNLALLRYKYILKTYLLLWLLCLSLFYRNLSFTDLQHIVCFPCSFTHNLCCFFASIGCHISLTSAAILLMTNSALTVHIKLAPTTVPYVFNQCQDKITKDPDDSYSLNSFHFSKVIFPWKITLLKWRELSHPSTHLLAHLMAATYNYTCQIKACYRQLIRSYVWRTDIFNPWNMTTAH